MLDTIESEVEVEPHGVDFDDDAALSGKIYCANCIHCKVVPSSPDGDERYFLRVRCDAGKWRKKLGEEKVYKYCTVARRSLSYCDAYEEMGDPREYLRELKKTLPVRDELYVR
jgi:hypothetical protein